jgi:hypothetical protein
MLVEDYPALDIVPGLNWDYGDGFELPEENPVGRLELQSSFPSDCLSDCYPTRTLPSFFLRLTWPATTMSFST